MGARVGRQYYQSSLFERQPFVLHCGRLPKAFELALTLSQAQRRPAYVLARSWDPMNIKARYAACLRMDLSSVAAEGYRVVARVESRLRWKIPMRDKRLKGT